MKFNVYYIEGYKGDENAYDGPEDYNFKEYVAIDAKYSKDETRSRLSALAQHDCSPHCGFVGHYEFVGTVEMDPSALNRRYSCEIRYGN